MNSKSRSLLIMAAGMGSRYGGLKQIDALGPDNETLMDYSILDALDAGFNKIVFVIRKEFEAQFRKQVGSNYEAHAEVHYVYQELTDLPEGYTCPKGRQKPWGTAHAVWVARNVIHEPFAVINADDYYGRESFRRLAEFLSEVPQNVFAMVGFRLKETLSDYGSVSRGICDYTEDDWLLHIEEHPNIIKKRDEIISLLEDGEEVLLDGDEFTSMNCWGFSPEFMKHLEAAMVQFIEGEGSVETAECYLPFVVDKLMKHNEVRVKILPTNDAWFGITYPEDRAIVQQRLRLL